MRRHSAESVKYDRFGGSLSDDLMSPSGQLQHLSRFPYKACTRAGRGDHTLTGRPAMCVVAARWRPAFRVTTTTTSFRHRSSRRATQRTRVARLNDTSPVGLRFERHGGENGLLQGAGAFGGHLLNDLLPPWNIVRHEFRLHFASCWRLSEAKLLLVAGYTQQHIGLSVQLLCHNFEKHALLHIRISIIIIISIQCICSARWRLNELKAGQHVQRKAPEKKTLSCRYTFLALQVQLVVLVSAFVMVSKDWSVSCLLFFYSRCPPCPAICKSGARAPRAPWSRRR